MLVGACRRFAADEAEAAGQHPAAMTTDAASGQTGSARRPEGGGRPPRAHVTARPSTRAHAAPEPSREVASSASAAPPRPPPRPASLGRGLDGFGRLLSALGRPAGPLAQPANVTRLLEEQEGEDRQPEEGSDAEDGARWTRSTCIGAGASYGAAQHGPGIGPGKRRVLSWDVGARGRGSDAVAAASDDSLGDHLDHALGEPGLVAGGHQRLEPLDRALHPVRVERLRADGADDALGGRGLGALVAR